jgi:ubiquinone/menaquinone biosynthesis C-methylase UbiE
MTRDQDYGNMGSDYHWRWWVSRMDYRHWIARILSEFPRDGDGTSVLNIGCGDGVPAAQLVARGFRVHGVDSLIAPLQIAQEKVPNASFSQEYPAEIFDFVLITDVLDEVATHPQVLEGVRQCRQYALVTADSDEHSEYTLERLFKGCTIEQLFEDQDHILFRVEPRR